ncbi:GNAT family N-acetyltransferase [Streptomyces sp. LRE541]|uniref:GNAT family N-acetyltransferase n=1 Tax=Streptomyces sp. LRE541 TaxID=2931983 RepID=UPI0020103041|nr:GNAT family N-acetyltransferase [Streptomyces sp. LRE541]UPZ27366.1 GNAT family N-acetyltransferase [Streptomyces sp. LRE541]
MSDDHDRAGVRGANVRRARPEDVPALVASSAALFAEDAGTRDPTVDITWPLTHGAERFTAKLDDPARLLLVAERDGEVVGHLAGVVAEGSAMRPVKVATLVSLYVRPAHRGTRTGARLVAAFLDWAREQGAQQAEVTAYAANEDAVRFYERNGFGTHTLTLGRPL